MRYAILPQRAFSELTGTRREQPIQPLRREPGIVKIGNTSYAVTVAPREVDLDALEEERRLEYNAKKQARKPHDCMAADNGMYCGHS